MPHPLRSIALVFGIFAAGTIAPAQTPQPPPQERVAAIGISPLRAPLTADFSPGTTFTLEAWVYLANATESGWIAGKCLATGGTDPFLAFALQIGPGTRPQFSYSTGAAGSFRNIGGQAPLALRTWTHLAAVMDGPVTRLLVNGTVVATGTATAAPPAPAGVPFAVGRAFLSDGVPNYQPFPGYARQIRLWSVARSAAQITAALTETFPADRTGLVGAWPLDDASGATAIRNLAGPDRTLASGGLAADSPAFLATGPYFVAGTPTALTPPIQNFNWGVFLDFDSDGDPDLVTFGVAPSTVPETRTPLRAFRNDRGSFVDVTAAVLGHVTMTHPSDFVVADFDGDGRVDLFASGIGSDTPPFPREQARLFLQTAAGRLADATARLPPRLTFTHGVATGDIDGDGDLDLYLGRVLGGATPPYFYLNDGRANFSDAPDRIPAALNSGGAGDNSSHLADLDGDRRPDLILGGLSGPNELLLNDGRGRFARDARYTLPAKLGGADWITNHIVSADFDSDGRTDLALATTGGTTVFGDGRAGVGYGIAGLQIVLNPVGGPLRDATGESGITFANDELHVTRITVVDLNRDRRPDLLLHVATTRGFGARLFLNQGPGHVRLFRDVSTANPLSGAIDWLAADADADGQIDLLALTPVSLSLARGVQPLLPGRLANLSVRTQAGSGDATLIAGFALGGTTSAAATKPLLVRAVGPTLAAFGVENFLADPALSLAPLGAATLAANDNWSGTAALKNAFAAVGAFALASDTSRDAALLVSPTPGAYTATVSGGAGVALVEVYDAGPGLTPRLTNVSARTRAGTGAEALIVGFVVDGTLPKRLLIRAAGPTLGAFGVGGTLADPVLTLRALGSETVVAANDDWSGTAALKSAFASVSAFAFPSDTSRDAALAIELAPGAYTATVSGKQNTTGIALVEVYELP